MSKRLPLLLMLAGTLLLLLAGGFLLRNTHEDSEAGRRSRQLLEQVQAAPLPQSSAASDSPSPEDVPGEEAPSEQVATLPDIAGVLSLPTLGLELPVLQDCTDELLKLSVCRYEGLAAPEPERLVIAGHNYKSHFKRLTELAPGSEIVFTSLEGESFRYEVTELAEIGDTDYAGLQQGDWDLTLLTCNFDRTLRVLVRCVRAD